MSVEEKKLRGGPAFKVWIPKTMQVAMARFRDAVNWSAFVRTAIERKLKELTK